MFKKILLALALMLNQSFASDYITLNQPIKNSENSVIEVFSYKCIHCYNHHKFGTLERLGEFFPNLNYKLYPVSLMNGIYSQEINELFALARFKDELENKDASSKESFSKKLADVFFVVYFVNKKPEFTSKNEVYEIGLKALNSSEKDLNEFLKTSKASEILNEFQRANDLARTFGTPSFIINGKYQLNPEAINSMSDLQKLVEELSKK